MTRSVMFRVYDSDGNVVFAEVRNYTAKTRTHYVRKHCHHLMRTIPNAQEVSPSYPDEVLDAGIWLDATSDEIFMQEVYG